VETVNKNMKQNEYTDLPKLSMYRFENFFNVYSDVNDFKFYNILKNISLFPSDNSSVEIPYIVKYNDTWGLISYKNYNTIDLWWLVCSYNQIQNPVKMPTPGTQIKILKSDYVGAVILELNKQINR
jgi:hypothetical protein